MNRHEVIVDSLELPARVSDICHLLLLPISSKSQLKKQIKKGNIFLNGKKAYSGDWVKNGDKLTFLENQRMKSNPHIPIEIVYEDEDLAIVVKPFGLPTSGNRLRQLDNALPHCLRKSQKPGALVNPQAIHRLDGPTYGLLIIAKTKTSLQLLNAQLEKKEIQKYYRAIVLGKVEDSLELKAPINSQPAFTKVYPIQHFPSKRFQWISLVKLQAITGRTHQLRIHLSQIDHPIMGDRLYCPEDLLVKGKGLYLAATELQLHHPISKEALTFEIDLPKKFQKIIQGA